MTSGSYVRGSHVDAFEVAFARYCGVSHCVGVANGYDALLLALRAVGVSAGDEVIVSGHTFIATWLAILQLGARPVPVDADLDTMLIDSVRVQRAATAKTKAIVAVPLYGQPVDIEKLRAALGGRRIPIVEDAAQAHGATLRGRMVGSLADAASFSFYPGKNLGAFGDGGAVVSSNREIIDSVRRWANYGSTVKYHHDDIGLNSRLDELQAAFLMVKLAAVEEWTNRRRTIAGLYTKHLGALEGLKLPAVAEGAEPAWHLYVVRHKARDTLARELAARGVETLIHYPIPPHRSKALEGQFCGLSLPVTEEICRTCLSLPMGPHLTSAEAQQVIEATKAAVRALD
jgi:dTDP-3-amino-3,4,6-trideoxy-alpha-D-glucose transaminase